jgi:hypothetical protein
MRRALFIAVLCSTAPALAGDPWVNPANMGANALPVIPAEVPWASDYTLATVGLAYQQGRLGDQSLTPVFRLTAPFGKWVTAIFDGAPIEAWWSSPRTQIEWALPRTQGVAKADIRFGVKLLLLDIGPRYPKLAFRALTKTTTGKDYDARRFTDAPGYLLDGLLGQRFFVTRDLVLDLYGSFGFFAWQQGSDRQNDAVHVALGLTANLRDRLQLDWQWRAYFGWQKNGDRPIVAALRVGVNVASFAQVGATATLGFLDAPRLDARIDVTFRLPAVVPLLFNVQ